MIISVSLLHRLTTRKCVTAYISYWKQNRNLLTLIKWIIWGLKFRDRGVESDFIGCGGWLCNVSVWLC